MINLQLRADKGRWVKVVDAFAVGGVHLQVGEVVELSSRDAANIVGMGRAEYCEAPAAPEEPETAPEAPEEKKKKKE